MTSKTMTEAQLAEAFEKANAAGIAAAEACRPTPMVVQRHANALYDDSPVVQEWYVPTGVCGFAWITIHRGTSRLANYAKKHHGAQRAYYGGVEIWVSKYGQSMETKEAYAYNFAKVLAEETGDEVYAGSRMD